jgi:hypothetical protein
MKERGLATGEMNSWEKGQESWLLMVVLLLWPVEDIGVIIS